MASHVCAVDVGTGSARAAILDGSGAVLGRGEHAIQMHRSATDHAEHDSEDIWRAVCASVRSARDIAGVGPGDIAGIGFDATCSLVVRGRDGGQLSVSLTGEARWDTIVWLDHRAHREADECTASGHSVLEYLCCAMSPEMVTPKLIWLKRNLPRSWEAAGHFFDLADFLTFRASGSLARSHCTLTCKWAYLAHEESGWPRDFFAAVGIGDVIERGRLPERPHAVGAEIGGLTQAAARDLGLTPACRVAAGLIDAYAGALGVLGGLAADSSRLERNLALIAGTSSCVMAMSPSRRAFPGGWGPYFGAALPGFWIAEGGQSAAGALLDHLIRWHAAGGEPSPGRHRVIVERTMALRAEEGLDLAGRLHVLPDFHGNRSPLADPHALGVLSGLSLDASFDGLCRLYWRTAVAIALGVRHIVETLAQSGLDAEALHVAGGHTRNELLMELYADAVGRPLVEPVSGDAVLLGTGMAVAAAAGIFGSVVEAAASMRQPTRRRLPRPEARARFDRDYRIFLEMHRQRRELEAM